MGTSSPFSKLSINSNGAPTTSGNVATTGLSVHNGTGGTAIQMGTNDSAYSYIQSTYVNAANNKRELRFILGDTTALTLDTSTNATFAGNISVADSISIGDDAVIDDMNVANTIRVKGQQASNQGFIVFADNNTAKLGCNNSSTLTYGSNFQATGNLSLIHI